MKRLYVVLLITLAVFGLAGFVFWRYFYLGTLSLDVTPKDALVTINDKPTPDRVIRLPKGTYTIKISSPGYRDETFNLQTGYGSQTTKKATLISLPKPAKILEGPIHSLAVSGDKKVLFFEKNNVLYQYDTTAATPIGIPITPQLKDIATVMWSPDFKLALLKKTDGEVGLYDFNRYDLLHQEYRPYGKDFKQVVWSPDGDGFYAEFNNGAEYSLLKANPTNTSQTRLTGLGVIPFQNFVLSASSPNDLLISGTDPLKPADIIRFDAYQKVFTPLTDTGNAYGPVISPDKNKIAYIDNGELVSADKDGKNKRNLGVRANVKNYAFLDNTTLVAITPNLITTINTGDGTKKEYEVYAPSDAVSSITPLSSGKSILYVFNNDLYRLDFTGTP